MSKCSPASTRLGFHIHAAAFVATIAVLVVVDVATSSHFWVQWPALSWGIGLFAHWWFGVRPVQAAVN